MKPVCTSSEVSFLTSTLSLTVASNTNVWDGPIDGPLSPYIISSLFVVGKVWPNLSVPIPVPYITFTWWVPGSRISVKRVSSLFSYRRSLPCMFRKLKIYLELFLFVSSDTFLIAIVTVPIGSGRVTP